MRQRDVYSLGVWRTKPGREKDFIEAWRAFAQWTADNLPGAIYADLMRDIQDPQRFVSMGPWRDAESILAWRELPEFRRFLRLAKELCEEFQPMTLGWVAHIERARDVA